MRRTYEVVGIGNAIVDVSASVDDTFLDQHQLIKGSMALIEAAQVDILSSALVNPVVAAGGSTSNTLVGIASFGGAGAFVGAVANDELGASFIADLNDAGIDFLADPQSGSLPTAQSVVVVTPDAERTMNTYLGVAAQIDAKALPVESIADSQILFVEGYLWESPMAVEAVEAAVEVIKSSGGRVAMSLSDPFCVDRNREAFRRFLVESVDIVFGNDSEVAALYETDVATASIRLGSQVSLAFITSGAEGSVAIDNGTLYNVAAQAFGEVVDTTGAGDQYAAGVLYGLTQGFGATEAAKLGSVAGGEVVTHFGPRPQMNLSTLASSLA